MELTTEVVDLGGRRYREVDGAICDAVRSFATLGPLLIEMRDDQLYRSAGFATFEDYCKSRAGIGERFARRTIQSYLAFRCISGGTMVPPETERQVRALLPCVTWETEKRPVQKQDGSVTYVTQPVGVKNPKTVAEQWERTVREYERRKAKAEKEGKKPPTLSAKFIRNCLPNELKVCPERGFDCNPLVLLANRLSKLVDHIDENKFCNEVGLKKLIDTEPPAHPAQVGSLCNELEEIIDRCTTLLELASKYATKPNRPSSPLEFVRAKKRV